MSTIRFDLPHSFRGPIDLPDPEWVFNQSKSQAGQDLFVIAMTQGKRQGTWLEIGCGWPICSNNTYLLEKRLGWRGISIDVQKMDADIITPYEEYWTRFYPKIRKPSWPQQVVHPDQIPDSGSLQDIPYFRNFIDRQKTDIDQIPKDQRCWHTARPGADFCQADALAFDYAVVPAHTDYLQIDIHPSSSNLRLLDLVLPDHRFTVITFEHDAWDHSQESAHVRSESRAILKDHGYQLVISDATVPPGQGTGIGDEPINFEDWWVDPAIVPETVWRLYQDLEDRGDPKYYWHTLLVQEQ